MTAALFVCEDVSGDVVEKRDLEQWYIKITAYAERHPQLRARLLAEGRTRLAQRDHGDQGEHREHHRELQHEDLRGEAGGPSAGARSGASGVIVVRVPGPADPADRAF